MREKSREEKKKKAGEGVRNRKRQGVRRGQKRAERKKEKMEGDIDCSQAEGALCGAWRWALRTPGLSLLSGPEEKQTYISGRVRAFSKCVCNCMCLSLFFISKSHRLFNKLLAIPANTHTFSLLISFPPIKAQKNRLAGQAIHLKSPCDYSQNMPLGEGHMQESQFYLCQSCTSPDIIWQRETEREKQGDREGRRERESEMGG